jgi:hypothetical protein
MNIPSSDAVISYRGQTIRCSNVSLTHLSPSKDDYSHFTTEQIEEAISLGDAIIAKYEGKRFKAFMDQHPNGGRFYFAEDGSVGFEDPTAFLLQRGWTKVSDYEWRKLFEHAHVSVGLEAALQIEYSHTSC